VTIGKAKLNDWPLDEGLIDYVHSIPMAGPLTKNAAARLNVIRFRPPPSRWSGTWVTPSTITPEFLANFASKPTATEANVASGYHAVEVLACGGKI